MDGGESPFTGVSEFKYSLLTTDVESVKKDDKKLTVRTLHQLSKPTMPTFELLAQHVKKSVDEDSGPNWFTVCSCLFFNRFINF